MADLKLSDLLSVTTITDDTFLYAVQDGISKKLTANIFAENLINPVFKGSITFEGVQLIKATDTNKTISLAKSRTEFDIGPFVIYPTLPNGTRDGLVKILTLANVKGGTVEITTANSNIYPNVSVSLYRPGDSIMLIYSSNSYSNGWVIVGTTPGLRTSLELPEANVSDERIRRAISAKDETINYDEANGTIQIGDLSNIVAQVSLANITTDELAEGLQNLYFTGDRANTALEAEISRITKAPANVIYVAKNGNDFFDGYTPANALANIHIALGRIAQYSNTFWTVQVFPGDYTLFNNPVTIPARSSLIGNDLRTTTIRPQNPTSDMFYMNNGVYVFGFTFRGHRSINQDSVRSGSACFTYNPDGSAGTIVTSPYVQNCSSITTSGTGIRVDGDHVQGLRSMVLDAFTQFNEGGIGIHLINKGYMQLVSLFTICCEYSVLCENGGFGSITNSNSSFGRYGLFADGVSPKLYTANVVQQVNNRIVEMTVSQRPNVNDRILMANYNQSTCYRDTGLIVDSLAFDLAYQSNTQSRFSGLQYWSQGINLLRDQRVEVLNTLEYLKTLVTNVVVNSTAWDIDNTTPYQIGETQTVRNAFPGENTYVANIFDLYLNIYNNGVFNTTNRIVPNKYPANTNVVINNTANLLIANKQFIQSEINEYFNSNYSYASYLPDRSLFNDVGEIIDSLTFDVLHQGNRQTITKAILAYYEYLGGTSSAIRNQVVQTSAAFSYIKTIIADILLNQPIANTYQNLYTQNTSIAANVTFSEIDYVKNRIDDITLIIENGPTYTDVSRNIRPISLVANTNPNIIAATSIILSNRNFIQAEVLEYTNQNWKDISNGTRNFYTVNESSNVDANGICLVTFDERILAIDRPQRDSRVSFHQGSYLSASSHTFEYVGSGTQLNAGFSILGQVNNIPSCLPYNGGVPNQELEVVESRGGAVYYTSTDHKGDFRIGNELLINRATGTINGRTFNKSLFAVMTPYILAIQ